MSYPSDMSDEEWGILEAYVRPYEGHCRPRQHEMRRIIDGIRYVLRSGCQWRMLPQEYPPWSAVYYYYSRWQKNGKWDEIHDALRRRVRQQVGKHPEPSVAIIDSQSVKTMQKGGNEGSTTARR